MVAAPLALFMQTVPESVREGVLQGVVGNLSRIGLISGALVAVIVAVLWLRSRLATQKRTRTRRGGCGYDLPNARMQYSGASFSTDFSQNFQEHHGLAQAASAGWLLPR